jgi:thiamine biosynthesis lipoprotein
VGEALGAAWAELRRLDGLVSHLPDSDVGRVNAAAGSSSVVVGEETFSLVRRCLEYAEFSGGVFDVTYAALSPLWRFDPGQPGAVPDAREVARLRKLVDYRKVVLDEPRRAVMLPAAGMRMGLGGIARGYAVDRVARVLEGQGLASVAVRAGSATLVAGPWPEDQRKVALLDPRAPSQVMAWVEVKSGAVSVVRDDERAFVAAGKRYHPVIDPRTGYPARASRLAAVLARTATDAEWLARTVFIRGLAESTRALASVAGAEALVVTEQNVVDMTPGMRRHVTVVADPTPGDP